MPNYTVQVAIDLPHCGDIEIEAESQADAIKKVKAMAVSEEDDYDDLMDAATESEECGGCRALRITQITEDGRDPQAVDIPLDDDADNCTAEEIDRLCYRINAPDSYNPEDPAPPAQDSETPAALASPLSPTSP